MVTIQPKTFKRLRYNPETQDLQLIEVPIIPTHYLDTTKQKEFILPESLRPSLLVSPQVPTPSLSVSEGAGAGMPGGRAESAGRAPLAAEQDYILVNPPRGSNTGNSSKNVENQELRQYAKIDYLTLTCGFSEAEPFTRGIEAYLMYETDIAFNLRRGGWAGYNHSAALNFWLDNEYIQVGLIAWNEQGESKNMGAMFTLTGRGCDSVNLARIQTIAETHGARITRIDQALDLDPQFCRLYGYTVPKLGQMAYSLLGLKLRHCG